MASANDNLDMLVKLVIGFILIFSFALILPNNNTRRALNLFMANPINAARRA
jgi:hypothetical protein